MTTNGHTPTKACNTYLGDILRAGGELQGNPRCFCAEGENPPERTCDGSCQPMCAWCSRQADMAADTRMEEEGYE